MTASPDGNQSMVAHISVWMELRPALGGFYGIPQETRLLFSALAGFKTVKLAGFLQMSKRPLRGGIYGQKTPLPAVQADRSARVVASLKGKDARNLQGKACAWVSATMEEILLRCRVWLGLREVRTGIFEADEFADDLWQALFERTLPITEKARVMALKRYHVCAVPWRVMHKIGLDSARILRRSHYPHLQTNGADVFIAQTPYPGRVSANTKLVVRYHDAIPILMPQTIEDSAFHQASHYHALADNVRSGGYFACVSESTRQDLITLFPEAAARAVTIHNMLPAHYFPVEPEPDLIPDLVRRYTHKVFAGYAKDMTSQQWVLNRQFKTEEEQVAFLRASLAGGARFLLMVSTIEPRKNHAYLLAAWAALHRQDPQLHLIFVGNIRRDYAHILDSMVPWIEEGSLFLLQNVPSEGLRQLFRQAVVTVCPSLGEGFGFSGVEAMRCGGVVAASDLPIHREIYGDSAVYFDLHNTDSIVETLRMLIYSQSAETRREQMRASGIEHSLQYLPERLLPKWASFLQRITACSA